MEAAGAVGVHPWPATRGAVLRDAFGIGAATGAYALSFGAISVTAGLTLWQTCALSLLMFTGASQFALVGVLSGGGSAAAGAATAVLLGARNALYGLRLSALLRARGARRALAAQFVIDESTAMAIAREDPRAARLGFWATGISVFVCWNAGTAIGGLATHALSDPRALGLDAAAPAAFLALIAPRLRSAGAVRVAVPSALVALASVPLVPAGVPVLLAALVAAALGARPVGERSADAASPPSQPDAAAP